MSFLWDKVKQNSPRREAAKRGVPCEAILFAYVNFNEKWNKNEILLQKPIKLKESRFGLFGITCLCNIQQYFTAVKMLMLNVLIFFLFLLKTLTVGTRKKVLTSTQNLCLRAKIRK